MESESPASRFTDRQRRWIDWNSVRKMHTQAHRGGIVLGVQKTIEQATHQSRGVLEGLYVT